MLHHIEIYVADVKKSYAFYSYLLPKLGFNKFQEWEQGFSFKDNDAYLVFVQTEETFLKHGYHRKRIGLNHLAFCMDTKDEVDRIAVSLKEKGVSLLYENQYPYAGGPSHYACYFEDPDRIKLEIVAVEEN